MFEEFAFRIADHPKEKGVKIVEFLKEGKVIATIHPTSSGLKIISKLIPEDPEEAIESGIIFFDCNASPPELQVNLIQEEPKRDLHTDITYG